MAINAYGVAVNGNPTNVHAIASLLKSADVVEVLDKVGVKLETVPMNKNETVSWLRAVTPDPRLEEVAEGVNPPPRALVYEQVTKTFEEYAEVFAVTSRQAELGEYDVLAHSKDRAVDLMRRTREKNAWFEYRAGNQRLFNSAAHSNRNQVNGPLTNGRLKVVVRALNDARAEYIREMTKGSVNQATVPVEPAYIALGHTDLKADIRNIPGFIAAPKIGGIKDYLPQLFGYVDDIAFVLSPEFEPFRGEGAAVGSTGMKSVGGTNIDVYPIVVFGKEALGKCSLRGADKGLGTVTMEVLDKADKSDPTNQRRLVSLRWWDAPVILNQSWVYRIEVACTDNPL
jgi:N4-gp56 family major capsid protein